MRRRSKISTMVSTYSRLSHNCTYVEFIMHLDLLKGVSNEINYLCFLIKCLLQSHCFTPWKVFPDDFELAKIFEFEILTRRSQCCRWCMTQVQNLSDRESDGYRNYLIRTCLVPNLSDTKLIWYLTFQICTCRVEYKNNQIKWDTEAIRPNLQIPNLQGAGISAPTLNMSDR
jgi:hypothetical protein